LRFTDGIELVRANVRAQLDGIQVLKPILWGGTGIGKTESVRQLAADLKLPIKELVISQMDRLDWMGVPDKKKDGDKELTRFLPPDFLPYKGKGIIFLDEINVEADAIKPCLQFLNEGRVGSYELPKGWAIVAAANPPEENELAVPLARPIRSRLMWIKLDPPTIQEWAEWARENNVHEEIVAFLFVHPALLYRPTDDLTFPTPRAWARLSQLVAHNHLRLTEPVVASHCGSEVASKFTTWRKIVREALGGADPWEFLTSGRILQISDYGARVGAATLCIPKMKEMNDIDDPKALGEVFGKLDPEITYILVRFGWRGKKRIIRRLSIWNEMIKQWKEHALV